MSRNSNEKCSLQLGPHTWVDPEHVIAFYVNKPYDEVVVMLSSGKELNAINFPGAQAIPAFKAALENALSG